MSRDCIIIVILLLYHIKIKAQNKTVGSKKVICPVNNLLKAANSSLHSCDRLLL